MTNSSSNYSMPIAGPNSGAELRLPPWSRLLELNVCIPIIAYFIAFHLLAFVVRRNTWMTFDGFKQYRLRNLTVCLFHSTVTGCWALSFLLLYPDIMFHHTIHWYEPFAAHLPMISIGYFCYDATDMLRHEISRWTLELLLHHVACVFVFLMAVLPQKFLPYATWALLMEINSIFLHIRSIMQLSGEAERNADKYKLSQAANIITFVLFRFLVQIWQIQWCFRKRNEMHAIYACTGLIGGLFFFILNAILFYRILSSDGILGAVDKEQNVIARDAIHEKSYELLSTQDTSRSRSQTAEV